MKATITKMSLAVAICITIALIFLISYDNAQAQTSKTKIIPITSEDFIKPIWHPDATIINAGAIGRYKFSIETGELQIPENVKIRPELIKLLNDLQKEFNTSMIIMSGYLSQEQDIYLWASWLSDNTKCMKALNEKQFKSWSEWVDASQHCSKIFPICSKHQTGDAVDFYWKGLDFQTEKKRNLMVALINEIAGSRKYTEEERGIFEIAKDDDSLLKIVAYMPGEGVSILNPKGDCYFHIEYQPSEFPPKPDIEKIGSKMSDQEEQELFYKNGEYVLIEYDDFLYPAKIMADSDINALEVNIHIFCDQIRKDLGDTISKNLIHVRRQMPEDGWGKSKVMLEYLQNEEWLPAMDALEYEDYYVVPDEVQGQLTVPIKNVRFPVAKIH
jgi:hypothetical protein